MSREEDLVRRLAAAADKAIGGVSARLMCLGLADGSEGYVASVTVSRGRAAFAVSTGSGSDPDSAFGACLSDYLSSSLPYALGTVWPERLAASSAEELELRLASLGEEARPCTRG